MGRSVVQIRLIVMALMSLLISGCSGLSSQKQNSEAALQALQVTLGSELKHDVNLQSVPFFPQDVYQCGPAALATVLTSQGVSVLPEDLVSRVYLPEQEASLPLEMVATGRSFGLLAYKLKPSLAHLLQQVDAGHPVLVFQNLAFYALPQWHFALVVGYILGQQELILRSARTKEYRIDFKTFLNTWNRADQWAYVFLEPGELPAQADPVAYLHASLDLVNVGLDISAQKALAAGVEAWPKHHQMRMALSNVVF